MSAPNASHSQPASFVCLGSPVVEKIFVIFLQLTILNEKKLGIPSLFFSGQSVFSCFLQSARGDISPIRSDVILFERGYRHLMTKSDFQRIRKTNYKLMRLILRNTFILCNLQNLIFFNILRSIIILLSRLHRISIFFFIPIC